MVHVALSNLLNNIAVLFCVSFVECFICQYIQIIYRYYTLTTMYQMYDTLDAGLSNGEPLELGKYSVDQIRDETNLKFF